jgi:hypothetical protein
MAWRSWHGAHGMAHHGRLTARLLRGDARQETPPAPAKIFSKIFAFPPLQLAEFVLDCE